MTYRQRHRAKKCYWDNNLTQKEYNDMAALAEISRDTIIAQLPDELHTYDAIINDYYCARAARMLYDSLGV